MRRGWPTSFPAWPSLACSPQELQLTLPDLAWRDFEANAISRPAATVTMTALNASLCLVAVPALFLYCIVALPGFPRCDSDAPVEQARSRRSSALYAMRCDAMLCYPVLYPSILLPVPVCLSVKDASSSDCRNDRLQVGEGRGRRAERAGWGRAASGGAAGQ